MTPRSAEPRSHTCAGRLTNAALRVGRLSREYLADEGPIQPLAAVQYAIEIAFCRVPWSSALQPGSSITEAQRASVCHAADDQKLVGLMQMVVCLCLVVVKLEVTRLYPALDVVDVLPLMAASRASDGACSH